MADTADTAHVIIRLMLAWGLAIMAGLALEWLMAMPFLPPDLPAGWLGALVFVLTLSLFAWAIITMTRAGSNVPTNRLTTTIVESQKRRGFHCLTHCHLSAPAGAVRPNVFRKTP
jgi:hypothetical protein